MIITCRTSYFEENGDLTDALGAFVAGAFRAATLYLEPFAPKQAEMYLRRRYQRMNGPDRSQTIAFMESIGTLRGRPLLYHHVEDLLRSQETTWNVYATYDCLITAWFEREKGRLRKVDRSLKFSDEAALTACIRLAQQMALSPTRHRIALSALEPDDRQWVERLECQGRSLLRKLNAGAYRFTHESFQEFFVALGTRKGLLTPNKQRLPASALIVRFLIAADDAATLWSGLDLLRAGFCDATIRRPDFSRSMLQGANFSRATLHQPSFEQAILTGWVAREGTFHGGQFQGAKATDSDLRLAKFLGGRWANATLAGSDLEEALFEACDIHHTLMANTNLTEAHFDRTTVSDSSFKGAWLQRARFSNCKLRQARFDQACLAGAHFSNTGMEQVSLQGADLRGAQLDEAFLDAIKSGQVKHWKAAAWDASVAKSLGLPPKDNTNNALIIDQSKTGR